MAKKPLEIDMCAGSMLRDTQGEMLSIEGADISELIAGRGRLNDNHGKGAFNSVGRITAAKKIFKEEDCDNDRQKYYWSKIKAPYIYVKGVLYDDEDHPNARAAAAILRSIHKADAPLKLKASVEGGVISRGVSDPSLLARTKIHSVALTFSPANNATLVEPLSLDKSQYDEAADMQLIKSVMHLAESNVPSFRHIVRDASADKVQSNLEKIAQLMFGNQDCIDIPSKQDILQYSLEEKIKNNILKIHKTIEQANQEDLDKGLKETALGAAMLGAALVPMNVQPALKDNQAVNFNLRRVPSSHQVAYKEYAQKNPILGAIGALESSGGKNYDHKDNPKDNAGGMFGMRPSAAAFILNKDKQLAAKYPELNEYAKNLEEHHDKITDRFNKDHKAAFDFAEALLNRNKAKTKDLPMLFHSWNHGLKGTWEKYKKGGSKSIQGARYVKKAMTTYANMLKQKDDSTSVLKALTAGYGGASAPTSLTGGGVFQTESLDNGRKGFKYVTCDQCGKEQIYSQHQIKCRHCGSSWSLEKLHNAMKN